MWSRSSPYRLGARPRSGVATTGLIVLFVAGCGDGSGSAPSGIRFDTLENGAVLVSNPSTGLWDSAAAWRVVEDLRLGAVEGDGPEVFSQVADLARDAYGRIYVLDRQAKEVRVFDAEGTLVRRIGREGSGPGEFEDPVALEWGPEGDLWVVDPGNGRFSVFDTTGHRVTAQRRAIAGYAMPWSGGFGRSGRFYDVTVFPSEDGVQTALIVFDSTLTVQDTIQLPRYAGGRFEHRTENSYVAAQIPFAPSMTWAFDRSGHIWFGMTDEYRIYKQALDGDTVRIVEKDAQPLPVTAEEKRARLEHLEWFTQQGGEVDESRVPDVKPLFQRIYVDAAGRPWVMPVVADEQSGRVLDVFDREGRFLGRVELPFMIGAFPPPVIGERTLLATTIDSLGVQYVVRATIQGTP